MKRTEQKQTSKEKRSRKAQQGKSRSRRKTYEKETLTLLCFLFPLASMRSSERVVQAAHRTTQTSLTDRLGKSTRHMLLAERNILDSTGNALSLLSDFCDPEAEFSTTSESSRAESVHLLAKTGNIQHSISDLLYVLSSPFPSSPALF